MNADIQRKSSVREEKLVLATLKKQQFKQDIDVWQFIILSDMPLLHLLSVTNWLNNRAILQIKKLFG